MTQKLSWNDRYEMTVKFDYLSIQRIMQLLNYGRPAAADLRKDAIEYCKDNNIPCPGKNVPTDVVLKLVGKTRDYFFNMKIEEKRLS